MRNIQEHTAGTFCWAELGATDTAPAKTFYSSLFGWTAKNLEGPGMIYTMFQLDGQDIAGLYEVSPKYSAPPGWLTYISVQNAEDTAEKVREFGGKIILPPMDVPEAGRAALFQDPVQALFGVWQPGQHIGARIINEANSMVWNELVTPDPMKAAGFYTKLFGWNKETMPMERFEYTVFKIGGKGFAGMLPMPPDATGLPPNWTVYFAVNDCDAIANKTVSLGGKIMMPPTDIPDIGRFAILRDPQDAMFAIIHPKM